MTWFSNEQGKKGVRIQVGQLADLIVPDRDSSRPGVRHCRHLGPCSPWWAADDLHGAGAFADFDESAPPLAMPDWSPCAPGGWRLGVQERRCSP